MHARKGAHSNGNSKGGPTLATDGHHNNNEKGDVRGPPTLGKVTLYGTDTAAGAAADNAECCHERGINKRWRPRHQVELRQKGVEALGNRTTNQTRGAQTRLRHNEWQRPRGQTEAQQEGEAEALGNVTTNQTRGAQHEAEL